MAKCLMQTASVIVVIICFCNVTQLDGAEVVKIRDSVSCYNSVSCERGLQSVDETSIPEVVQELSPAAGVSVEDEGVVGSSAMMEEVKTKVDAQKAEPSTVAKEEENESDVPFSAVHSLRSLQRTRHSCIPLGSHCHRATECCSEYNEYPLCFAGDCCVAPEGHCHSSRECCGSSMCRGGECKRSCQNVGGYCQRDGDCCHGSTCSRDRHCTNCSGQGQHCHASRDCCGSMHCHKERCVRVSGSGNYGRRPNPGYHNPYAGLGATIGSIVDGWY